MPKQADSWIAAGPATLRTAADEFFDREMRRWPRHWRDITPKPYPANCRAWAYLAMRWASAGSNGTGVMSVQIAITSDTVFVRVAGHQPAHDDPASWKLPYEAGTR